MGERQRLRVTYRTGSVSDPNWSDGDEQLLGALVIALGEPGVERERILKDALSAAIGAGSREGKR